MKKNILVLFIIMITAFGFKLLKNKPLHFAEHKRHFTAVGDINFDLFDTTSVMFIKMNLQGKPSISLGATLIKQDSVISTLSLVMINLKRKGVYSLNPLKDSCSSVINYSVIHNTSDINIYMSINTPDESNYIKIDSLSSTYISGSYKASVSNFAGTSLSASGIFAGDFYDQQKTDSIMKAKKLL